MKWLVRGNACRGRRKKGGKGEGGGGACATSRERRRIKPCIQVCVHDTHSFTTMRTRKSHFSLTLNLQTR